MLLLKMTYIFELVDTYISAQALRYWMDANNKLKVQVVKKLIFRISILIFLLLENNYDKKLQIRSQNSFVILNSSSRESSIYYLTSKKRLYTVIVRVSVIKYDNEP